ncbi:hypothetical protein EDD21DRAFT_363552 [Dissophora ornata]|nr:hypothetical protein EDD21DRAFT_363552 [Dissophora ornata]
MPCMVPLTALLGLAMTLQCYLRKPFLNSLSSKCTVHTLQYTDNADRYPHMATHLQWLLAKEGVKEHVNFPAFVKQFRLGDRQSATDVYLTLINYSSIRESRREKLREEFSFFQKNNAQEFWASNILRLMS